MRSTNTFQNRLPNVVVIGLVKSTAFNGDVGEYPFTFKHYNLSSIKQVVRGETYPFEALEFDHTDDSKEVTGNFSKPLKVCARAEETW